MITVPRYQLLSQIYESANSLVYRGIQEQDERSVILKILKEDYPTPNELNRYKQEYEIIRSLRVEGIIKAYSLEKYQNTLVMSLEDFGGESLRILMNRRKFALAEILQISLKIADSLGFLHRDNIIHKDINPSNIVINPDQELVKIIDFGISSVLRRENTSLKSPKVLEGTLAYMSPEQTGRMNRSLDYRTDFYSLGITLYELLTHQLPFTSKDPLELLHAHIAIEPVSPTQLNPEIPLMVSDIVMKLLAKNAEDRYQSAGGIKSDLAFCLNQLETKGKITNFNLGAYDFSGKFLIPQKLYGREKEITSLMKAFERVSRGQTELILVSGYSGVGKSALIREIYRPITKQKSYFISGKFDQYQRNIPYSAIIQAFQELVKQLLTESEEDLKQWSAKLLAALGSNIQVIIDVIPEVELIVGEQPAVTELGAAESENRFHLVFQEFLQFFCQRHHPFVIFLDDLQWADAATLKLLQLILNNKNTRSLFLIGAYRDNEVSAVHPLVLTIDELRKSEITVRQIQLLPLAQPDVNQLISDTLQSNSEESQTLTKLVFAKTQGNPFFLREFLHALYREQLLNFIPLDFNDRQDLKDGNSAKSQPSGLEEFSQVSPFPEKKLNNSEKISSLANYPQITQGGWYWNIKQIQGREITDNVIELMANKIRQLPIMTQQELQFAAAIGNQFNLETLAIVQEKSLAETAVGLRDAVTEGLVLPLGNIYVGVGLTPNLAVNLPYLQDGMTVEYKFAHDRIQQAAYSLIPEQDKPAVHRRVGQLLKASITKIEGEQKIFDIVNQLNLGRELIKHQSQRNELAELNLLAGKKAKAAAAYKPALKYFQTGLELLDSESWLQTYDLSLSLFVAAAEAAYLSADFRQQDELVKVVLQKANSLLDKVKVYEIIIQANIAHNQLQEAVKTALTVLSLLGVNFPKQPNKVGIWISFIETKLALVGKKTEDLINLPIMTDPDKLAAMRILSSVASAAYFTVPELMPLIVFEQVKLSVKYGNAPVSASAYASYGLILYDFLLDIETGYYFGQLALGLLSQLNIKGRLGANNRTKAKTLANVNFFAKPWKEHLNTTLQPLLEAYSSGLETGDFESAAYAAHNYCLHSYFSGKQLSQLQEEMVTYSEAISQLKQERTLQVNKLYRQVIYNLRGSGELNEQNLKLESKNFYPQNPCCLNGDLYDESKMLPQHQAANDLTAICVLHFNKLILCYLFGAYSQARENAALAEKSLDSLRGTIIVPLFHFYYSLTLLALYPQTDQPKSLLRQVRVNQKKMKKWANHAPMNHLHKFYLVEAEQYRVLRQDNQAAEFYDLAIEKARENEYLQEEAISQELAAKFYLAKGKTTIARAYMLDARYCYLQWGATAKIDALDKQYPQLLAINKQGIKNTKTITDTTTTTSRSWVESLDLATVMKSSQAISGEIFLENLLTNLMQMLIENAGAQKGFLILPNKGKLLIEAESSVNSSIKVLQSQPIDNNLPSSIINYVARSKKTVVLNNATCEGDFINDAYIKTNQPQSILCYALLTQSKLSGIVYLENNLTTGAFTSDRLEILKMLSSPASISIENAKLYGKLRERESQLSQFLEAMPVGVAVLDESGQPYYTNYRAKQLLEKEILPSAAVLAGKKTYSAYFAGTQQLYPAEQLAGVRALQGFCTSTDSIEIRQGDKVIPVEVLGTPIHDEQGNIAYALVVFNDITERKQIEAERTAFLEEVESKNVALQEVNQLKDEFFKNTSHELRTPLNGIIGSLRLILDNLCDDRKEEIELLKQADQCAINLLKIINQILEISKLKTGKISVDMKPVKLQQVLSEALDLEQTKIKDKNLKIYRNDFPQVILVTADDDKLKQVFLNTIENAIKFTDSGSITITTSVKAVPVEGKIQEKPLVFITIQDTGIGIEPSQQYKLFQPFVMVDGSTTRSQGGIGLGLLLSRTFLELMGGSINLTSPGKNQGTTVEIALPLNQVTLEQG
ncbi:MAG: AAA family ATPase [Coleofasciculaceae cyanobacterium]